MKTNKFATIIVRDQDNKVVGLYSKKVSKEHKTESVRNKLIREQIGIKVSTKRFVGVVKTLSHSSEDYYFVYEVTINELSIGGLNLDSTLKKLDNVEKYILNMYVKRQLTYHEIHRDLISAKNEDFIELDKSCVIIGSFRKHMKVMQNVISKFESAGISVLSPKNGSVKNPGDEFVLLNYDPPELTEGEIQTIVLKKMEKASFTYLINPEGYLGKSAAFEVGYGIAMGIKLIAMEPIQEMHSHFVTTIATPEQIIANRYTIL